MKQFQFKLDPVLKYRRYQEEQARMNLAEARLVCREIRSRMEDVCREKARMHTQLKQESRNGIKAGRYLDCRNFVSRLDRDLEDARKELRKQEKKVQILISQLKRQYIAKESLESLKSTHAGMYKQQMETELQKSSDELVLIRKGGGGV